MRAFNDNKGRVWNIEITIDAVKRLRDLLQLDLLETDQNNKTPAITRLGTDVVALIDAIFCLVQPQAESLGVSDIEFARSIGGKAALEAQNAFYEELADFFLNLGRKHQAKIVTAQKRMIELTIERLDVLTENLNPEAEVQKIFTDLPIN
jgi:hypothetical protein